MIPKGLFTQIAMVIISIGIVVTYVQPAFSEIGEVQDDIAVYQDEREKVVSVNSQLSSLVSRLESVAPNDQRRLNTYLPTEIDPIAIPRDLALITLEAGVIYNNVSYEGVFELPTQNTNDQPISPPMGYRFNLDVDGTYSQLKNLFRLLEQNNYPLEVHELDISSSQGGFLNANIGIVTYEYQPAEPNNQIAF